MKALSTDCRIVPILTYASANSDRTSKVIDTKGYDALCVLIHFGTIATGAVQNFYLQHAAAASDADTLTSGTDVAGTSIAVADDDDNQVRYIDVVGPLSRFYQLVCNKDATNACAESAIAILYRNKSTLPSTHAEGTGTSGGAAVVEGELHISPATGDE